MADEQDGPLVIARRDGPDFAAMLADYRARRLTNRPPREDRPLGRSTAIYEGVLESDLTGPACALDEPTSATVRKYRRNRSTKALEETTNTETVYNSDPDLEGPVGAYCRWQRIGGILQFVYVGCNDALTGCGSSSSGGV